MRLLSLPSLSVMAASIIGIGIPSADEQKVLNQSPAVTENATTATRIEVPGNNNNAFYAPIAKKDQIFVVDFLEIALSPIPVNKLFFILLRGEIPASHAKDITQDQLTAATVNITVSFTRPKPGPLDDRESKTWYTIPFRTAQFGTEAHLAIRDSQGRYVDYLTAPGTGYNDILTDYWIPAMFVETGNYTFEVIAELGDGRCLFAISVEQWLEGSSW